MSTKNTFCNDACYEVNKFNDPCNWFKGRIFFIITSEYTRWKLKCTFLIFHNINILHTLPLPLSLPLFLSLSLSLSLSLIACWFKPLVQTSDDYWQGSPPLPPRPPSTQNFNCQKIIMDTNRLGTIMSCKPTKKTLCSIQVRYFTPSLQSVQFHVIKNLNVDLFYFIFYIVVSWTAVIVFRRVDCRV